MKIIIFLIFSISYQSYVEPSVCNPKQLHCFDSHERNLGEIFVAQCWNWVRFSCQPCKADVNHRKIRYSEYIHECLNLYSNSRFVLRFYNVYDEKAIEFLTNTFKG